MHRRSYTQRLLMVHFTSFMYVRDLVAPAGQTVPVTQWRREDLQGKANNMMYNGLFLSFLKASCQDVESP